jgi:hypothetical protein
MVRFTALPRRFEGFLSHDRSLFRSERISSQHGHLLFGTGIVIGIDQPGSFGLIFLCSFVVGCRFFGGCCRLWNGWNSLCSLTICLDWRCRDTSSSGIGIGLLGSSRDKIVDCCGVGKVCDRSLSSTIEMGLRLRGRRVVVLLMLGVDSMRLRSRDLTLMHLLELQATDRWSTKSRTLRKSRSVRQTYTSSSHGLWKVAWLRRR